MSGRRAFSLIEVLVAAGLFGLAAAGLFMALQPVTAALVGLSEQPDDAGALAIVRAVAEAAPDRAALTQGGEVPLPTGVMVTWRATLEPTNVEALYAVTLVGERDGAPPLRAGYLHFEPRWAEPSEGAPQWLEHRAENASGQAGPAASAGNPGAKPGAKPGAPGRQPSGNRPARPPGAPAGGGRR